MTHTIYITGITYIIDTIELIFKAYKRSNKIFFMIFSIYKKMTNSYYQQHKTDSEMKHAKSIKIFLKKKKTKGEKMSRKDIKILLKEKRRRVSVSS